MNLEEVLNYRRSVRVYDPEQPLDTDRVRHCLELATLAPNSSNMQLWEFYHITQPELMAKISHACLDQSTTATASELVVFVARQDLFRKRARSVLNLEKDNIRRNSPENRHLSRITNRKFYYGELMPFLYSRFFGLIGLVRKIIVTAIGLFRPIVREVTECDARVMVHKSCALAAQTFMIAMANEGYDTCPIEGYDNKKIKKALNLPWGAEINMVVSCGIRKGNEGIRGDRIRIPFEEVYHQF